MCVCVCDVYIYIYIYMCVCVCVRTEFFIKELMRNKIQPTNQPTKQSHPYVDNVINHTLKFCSIS